MLKFATFTSDIELPFYTSLASHKINHDMLDDSARRVLGTYEIRPSDPPDVSCRMQIHGNALRSDAVPSGYYRAEGMIKNTNTIEEYRNLDKQEILSQAAHTVWKSINDGTIFSCPSLLSSFLVICFADLKKYKFTYLFGFPTLHSEPMWKFTSGRAEASNFSGENKIHIHHIVHMTGVETAALVDSVQSWRYKTDSRQHGFFLAKRCKSLSSTSEGIYKDNADRSISQEDLDIKIASAWEIGSLSDYETGFFQGNAEVDRFVAFADPSTYAEYPGWMLRNLLVLIRVRWQLNKVNILCYRDTQTQRDSANSIIFSIESESQISHGSLSSQPLDMPRVTGWERNGAGKVVSRVANLSEFMDPERLADQAVDLNLKLMKWRIAPSLNLDVIKDTKCLLLGAGTLGSYVSRNLMGWGVKKITFVDSGFVSYSNPVRQPLFNYNDCLAGGARKASRAADALREIYPGVESEGHVLSVPMVGHPIMDEASVKDDFLTLEGLIQEHDAVFLLMDTRESRWLPSVIGKATGKIVMNAALGFDSFVVMRHGAKESSSYKSELGCYFCNDVVAPVDLHQSMSDRTLDQQCTVTRPGVAAVASALLVEIFVSILQHPLRILAPAPERPAEDRGEHPLGIVPHQIRGFLMDFQNLVVRGKSYNCCSACSDKVVAAYKAEGWEFVKRALNERGYVEGISGLAEVQQTAERAMAEMEIEEEKGLESD